MNPNTRKNLIFIAAILLLIAVAIVFPRITRFAEMAGREFRFFWWLFIIAAIALYLAFAFRRGKK